MTVKKWVYFFGAGKAEGDGSWREVLGGKGAGLAEMTKISLPVPAGFTISTEACDYYYKQDKQFPAGLKKEVADNVATLERDRKSTRLNSSHGYISYAVFCLKKKKNYTTYS